jgi:hypothetical protein
MVGTALRRADHMLPATMAEKQNRAAHRRAG